MKQPIERVESGQYSHSSHLGNIIQNEIIASISGKILVVSDAATASTDATSYFGNGQKLYSIFSASPQRWAILRDHVIVALKTWSDTRWESRINSIEAVRHQVSNIREALLKISEVMDPLTKVEAQSLAEEVRSYRFLICTVVWYDILHSCEPSPDEPIVDATKRLEATFFNDIVDTAIQSLTDRFETLGEVRDRFGVLLNFQKLGDHALSNQCDNLSMTLCTGNVSDTDEEELVVEVKSLPSLPSDDMTALELLTF
ncbi:uncharacterized protein LOC143028971 [Oratosquilla oratoria]|uniref:uncharacterized protein LOC143028971 n=1 Tax=Oratosquilla oratoria TaxID=337810 RepID=UPI003F76031D